jgi:hypothetical protein
MHCPWLLNLDVIPADRKVIPPFEELKYWVVLCLLSPLPVVVRIEDKLPSLCRK